MNRREFLAAAGTGAAALSTALLPTQAAEPLGSAIPTPKTQPTIGIQIGSISFLDEGTEKVLDILQEQGRINTLFIATFTYGNGIAGRQLAGHPFPDHGVRDYNDHFHGGNYATPHPQFYKDTVFKNLKAPDHGDVDILEQVIPAARKRGVKVYTWAEDVLRSDVPGIEQARAVDFHGRPAQATLCFNNPNYFNFLLGLHNDFTARLARDKAVC